MDHTLALIGRIHQGDKEARDTLFSENMGLVYSVARRFLGRGVEMEDLFQIGSIGLLKAVDHFNPEFDVKFSTYAVPMIIGEIKRFLRDDGILKVSRSIKENQYKICKMREELEKKLGREPDLRELSDAMDMPMEELAMTLESAAEVDSIYKTVYQGDGTDLQLVDRLPEKEDRHEKLLNRIFLEEILEKLELTPQPVENFKYYSGEGADMLIRRCLKDAGDPELMHYEECRSLYREKFDADPLYKVVPYDGIMETLKELKNRGMKLAVCSNKPHVAAVKVIAQMFDGYFDLVIGQSDEIRRKPAPDGPLKAAQEFGVTPSECMYVGDTKTDMETGNAAKMHTVGVLWGFRDRWELESNGAEIIAEKPQDLLKICEEWKND